MMAARPRGLARQGSSASLLGRHHMAALWDSSVGRALIRFLQELLLLRGNFCCNEAAAADTTEADTRRSYTELRALA